MTTLVLRKIKENLIPLSCSILFLFSSLTLPMQAQTATLEWQNTPATSLTIINKLLPTREPYHRLDTEGLEGFTPDECLMARYGTGLTVAFSTDAQQISLEVSFRYQADGDITPANCMRGFDLYVLKNGQWIWAGTKAGSRDLEKHQNLPLASGLEEGMKDCLLYFPSASEIASLDILTPKGTTIKPSPSPFKGRIAVFGSSFTFGAGSSRAGMLWTSQLSRMTGYNFINMGFSGRSRLQDYFARALCEAKDVDAFIIDAFSNPSVEEIRERLFPFIEIIQMHYPGRPLIFLKTIFRESRLSHPQIELSESYRQAVADSMMRIATRRYDQVYWVDTTNATGRYHELTTDGTHPEGHGYTLWAESILKPITRILKRCIKD